jgi:anthranilate synthase component 1
MIRPDLEEFRRLAVGHDLVPVCREVLADLETPVSAFRKLAGAGDAALLESMEGGETWGRYSIIGCDPVLRFESRGRVVRLESERGVEVREDERPLRILDEVLAGMRTAILPGLPSLAGGAIGFVSYDMARRFERLPSAARDDLGLPDARFALFTSAVLFDHRTHTVQVVVHARPGSDPDAAWRAAGERIDELWARLRAPLAGRIGPAATIGAPATISPSAAGGSAATIGASATIGPSAAGGSAATGGEPLDPAAEGDATGGVRFTSTVSRERFCAAVERAREYIRAGDIVQAVLAHRLEAEVSADPFDVYRALRVINPSPYLFFLRLGELTLVGSSPEVLVRREGARVLTRPIAGTRGRGRDEAEDRVLEGELCDSEKERAEHLMLVDLGRNDLGRICGFGTVRTPEFMAVERYSHVMHLVSRVEGELRGPMGNAEVLEACFPAGTVSGAPKIRAMEIIDELEPVRRGVYAGAVGYLDFHGNMDTCIAIRTLLFRAGRAHLGVGAGIVADSEPEAEYLETLRKGSALVRACELAAAGLDRFSREALARVAGEAPGPAAEGR